MLCFTDLSSLQHIHEENLYTYYQELKPFERRNCLYEHLEKGISIPTSSSPYEMVEFYDNSKKSISLMCTILAYDNDDTMDGTILGFL